MACPHFRGIFSVLKEVLWSRVLMHIKYCQPAMYIIDAVVPTGMAGMAQCKGGSKADGMKCTYYRNAKKIDHILTSHS